MQELQSYVRLVALRSIRLTVMSALLTIRSSVSTVLKRVNPRAEAKALQFRSAPSLLPK